MKNAFGKIASVIIALCVTTVVNSHGQTLTTVLSLNMSTGSSPNALVQGTDGNFFGTALLYGQNGLGTGYEVTPDGRVIKVVSFCAETNCADGANPNAALLLAADGNYYGTTNGSGANGKGGTIFKLSPGGQLTTLYSFCSLANCADGGGPSVLVQGRDGNLYGITGAGGSGHQCSFRASGCGTVFKITTKGVLSTLHSFCIESGCADGYGPSSLILATDGGFYGTATQGGSGNGTFFGLSSSGQLKALHSFTHIEGSYPNGVVEGTDGNFYGTTRVQGSTGNGTIFQATPAGQVKVLYNFCSSSLCADGGVPWSGLVEGTDGNFYGTTNDGGTGQHCPGLGGVPCGTLFKITPAGEFTSLYSFCAQSGCPDGGVPVTALIQGTDGAFYGTTSEGANTSCNNGCGTVFNLSVGLAPFVEANPVGGKVGYKIQILGKGLTGSASVTFNGTQATFTVISDTLIKATVPSGATTGTIEVTTPGGTLNSNVAFQVLP